MRSKAVCAELLCQIKDKFVSAGKIESVNSKLVVFTSQRINSRQSTHDKLFQSTHEWKEGEEFSSETLHVSNVHIALNLLHLHHLHK